MQASIVTANRYTRVRDSTTEGPLGSTPVHLADDVVVWIDPLDTSRFAGVDVIGAAASPVVQELVGSPAASAATQNLAALDDAPDETVVSDSEIDLGSPLWPYVRRLGFLLWLEQFSPLALAPHDFDIEIGLAAHHLAALGTAELAAERLGSARRHLLDAVDRLVEQSISPPSHLVDVIRGAALAADAIGIIELDPQVTGRLTPESPDDRVIDLSTYRRAHPTIERGSLAAGGTAEHRSSVDWRRVPRGTLHTDDRTIAFSLDPTTSVLSVSVTAAGDRHSPALLFEVVDPHDGRVLVAGPLRRAPGETEYRGSCLLTGDPSTLLVDVRSVLSVLAPSVGPDRRRAGAVREATRAVTAERLARWASESAEKDDVVSDAARAWQRAALDFADLADVTGVVDEIRARACDERAADLRAGRPVNTEALTLAEWTALVGE